MDASKDGSRFLVRSQLRWSHYTPGLRVNFLKSGYANPVTFEALVSTATGVPTKHVAFEPLSTTEIAIRWVEKGTPGAVAVQRAGNARTASFSFLPVLDIAPGLEVESGYIQVIPYRIDEAPEGKRFVLELAKAEVVLSQSRERKIMKAQAQLAAAEGGAAPPTEPEPQTKRNRR
jgi:hypothetical protein